MGLPTLVTAADGEPVSLDEARLHLKVDIDDDDELIVNQIVAARTYLEEICGRAFMSQTFDYSIDGEWPWVLNFERGTHERVIEIQKAPLASVTSVTYVDSAGVTQTLAADQYVVDGAGSIGRIYPAYGVYWPSVRCQNRAITVRFVAGYGASDAVPQALKQALLLLVSHWFVNREPVTTGIAPTLPMTIDALIAPYRVFF